MNDIGVLVVGSIAYDTIHTPTGKIDDGLGGSATYGSLASSFHSRMTDSDKIALVGVVGKDFKSEHIDLFHQHGIKTDGLVVSDGETFRWEGSYSGNMAEAQTIDTQLNVFEHFSPVVPDGQQNPKVVFCANLHPAIQKSVIDQSSSARITMLDSMNLWINIAQPELLDVMKTVDMVIINDGEVKMLANSENLLEACDIVQEMTGVKFLIVKKGEHGVLALHDSQLISLPAFPTRNLCDPTGCGDTFAGTLASRLALGEGDVSLEELREALVHANVTASFTLESFSVDRLANLGKDEYSERLETYRKIVFGE